MMRFLPANCAFFSAQHRSLSPSQIQMGSRPIAASQNRSRKGRELDYDVNCFEYDKFSCPAIYPDNFLARDD